MASFSLNISPWGAMGGLFMSKFMHNFALQEVSSKCNECMDPQKQASSKITYAWIHKNKLQARSHMHAFTQQSLYKKYGYILSKYAFL